jgi:hypothetical protein
MHSQWTGCECSKKPTRYVAIYNHHLRLYLTLRTVLKFAGFVWRLRKVLRSAILLQHPRDPDPATYTDCRDAGRAFISISRACLHQGHALPSPRPSTQKTTIQITTIQNHCDAHRLSHSVLLIEVLFSSSSRASGAASTTLSKWNVKVRTLRSLFSMMCIIKTK